MTPTGIRRLDKAAVLLQSTAELLKKAEKDDLRQICPALTYCAVDIQHEELHRRLANLVEDYPDYLHNFHEATHHTSTVAVRGVCGSYDEFRNFMTSKRLEDCPTVLASRTNLVTQMARAATLITCRTDKSSTLDSMVESAYSGSALLSRTWSRPKLQISCETTYRTA